MPEFVYTPMFPLGKDTTEYDAISRDHVAAGECDGRPVLKVAPEGLTLLAERAFHDVAFLLRPSHLEAAGRDPQGPGELGQRPLRRPRAPEERRHLGRRRLPDVPGHGHGHHQRQEGPAGLHGRRRRRSPVPGRLQRLHQELFPLFPERRPDDVRREEHRHEPARPDRHRRRRRRRRTSSCSSPRAAARPTRPISSRKPRPSSIRRPCRSS